MYRFIMGLSKRSPLIHKRGLSFVFIIFLNGPFLSIGKTEKEELRDGQFIGDVILFDAAKEDLFTVPGKPFPKEIDISRLVGNTNGLGFFSNLYDRSLFISDYINPLASKSKPAKVIPLPPLTSLYYPCPTEIFCNVPMSASPFDDDDSKEEVCVVALNFLGRQLSFCETRPNRDWRWTNVVTPFTFLERSNLMYSKRDQRFYLPTPGSTCLCSWDLHFKKDDNPSFHTFLYRNRPKLSQSEHELLDFCSREEHWVESASGERFLLRCYTHDSQPPERDPVIMVFREEEITEKGAIMCYTEDIGDLCIFTSEVNSFCLEASLCPGLIPNSIYLAEPIPYVYNLKTRSIRRQFDDQVEKDTQEHMIESIHTPYWLPPFSI